MAAWWEGISLLEQIFVIIAAPSTLILIIQTVMLIFGGGLDAPDSGLGSDVSGFGSDEGMDGAESGIGDPDIQAADVDGLRLFSIRGIMTFLTVFGWSGAVMISMGMHPAAAAAVSGLLGFASLYGMARMIKALMKLQESGNVNYRRALGKTARVYLTIPPAGQGQGKINLMLGDSLGEFWAVTESSEPIPTGTAVRVVDLAGGVYTVKQEE
ncbi:MAG: NfeD family protein [Oscillospiraceae bacterium]|nr:NfeD family protein [Oscillospiraceae bacterium]